MEAKKILYSAICIGGFAIAFVALRITGSALLGIGGILVCIYGLIEAMHLFTADSGKKPTNMSDAFPADEPATTACPHCGAAVPADNDFCGKCGKKIA